MVLQLEGHELSGFWATGSLETVGPLLNAIGIAVFVIGVRDDGGFEIEFINRYYEATFGVESASLVGRRLEDVLSAEQTANVSENYRRCIETGEVDEYDEEIELPSGPFFSRTVLTPLSDQGRVVRLIGTSINLSDRRKLELELATARDRAEVANTAKSNFMANMSHELRTPLNAVIGYAELLQSELLGPIGVAKYRDYAGDIVFAGKHLLEIVNDILDLARIEGGKVELDEQEVDPNRILDKAILLSQEKPALRRTSVEAGRLLSDVRIRVDRRLIRQALVNLIANAQKFTKPGGRIYVGTEMLDDGRLCYVVTDTGRGIAAKDLPVALAPFGRVDAALSADTQGAGLGLPITKALVERHDGRLFINSQPGIGTSVFMVLPADRVLEPSGARSKSSVDGLKDFFQIDGVEVPQAALQMSDQMLDDLPIGAIQLNRDGKVLKYNATESKFSEMRAERVVGRDFFREVAPCTFTDSFHGRFREILDGKSQSELFSYVFTLVRPWKVLIEMRPGVEPQTVWLFIRWI
jgi:photoactive yellow protein